MATNFGQLIKKIKSSLLFVYQNGRNKMLFLKMLMLGIIREGQTILTVIFPAFIIDFIHQEKKINIVYLIILVYAVTLTVLGILAEYFGMSVESYNYKRYHFFKLKLNQKNMRLDYKDAIDSETYDKYEKAVDGVWEINDIDFYIFCQLFSKILTFSILTYIFISLNISIFILVFFSILLVFILEKKIEKKNHQCANLKSQNRKESNYIKNFYFDIKNSKEIKMYSDANYMIDKYSNVINKNININKKKDMYEFQIDSISYIISMIRSIIIYMVAINQYKMNVVTIGAFALYLASINQMTYTMYHISGIVKQIYKISLYFDDFNNYLQLPENTIQDGRPINSQEELFIEFKNVYFKYPNCENYILKNVSFSIKNNERVTLVGDNGAGKTTIVKLLFRLYRVTEGFILLNGVDINEYDYSSYLKLLMPVFQDNAFFPYTIKENLSFSEGTNDEDLYKVLKEVEIDNKVRNLNHGLNTFYTKRFYENGVDFSGGEIQKLSIARAIYKNGKICVLDEPTSSLDPIAEFNIYKMVYKIIKDKSCIFISHRLSSAKFTDKIIVINEGRIEEVGSHEELINQGLLYADMFRKQAKYYIE